MGETSSIAWTNSTFNPWWGCVRVSPGCEHCYAETFSHRLGFDLWGPKAGRRFFGAKHWNAPLLWNRKAAESGERHLVFCASMADVFEDLDNAHGPNLDVERQRLFNLIEDTPALTWQLLTKRPENVMRMLPLLWRAGLPRNVWILTTAEDQQRADVRVPILLEIPAIVRGVSYEPALGPIDFSEWLDPLDAGNSLDWIIVGGESGNGARPFALEWGLEAIQQCRDAGVPVFMKQTGARPTLLGRGYGLASGKGDHPAEWPFDLRVFQFPIGSR